MLHIYDISNLRVKNGSPIRNMVKCQTAQYDLILHVIGVGVGASLRIVCHFTETCRFGAVLSVTVGQTTKSSDLDA